MFSIYTRIRCILMAPPRLRDGKQAKRIGLSGIAVTDHNEIRGALEALKFSSSDFRVIPGVEVSSAAGHILALGVEEVVARGLPADETVDRIHALGGVAVAAHPFDRLRQGVGGLCILWVLTLLRSITGIRF